MTLPIDMQMTPIVAAVPNEVPMSTDSMQFSKKVSSKNALGRINYPAW